MVEKNQIAAAAARVRRRLETLQDHQRSVWFAEGFGLLILAVVPTLGAIMLLDNAFHLHWALRTTALLGLAAAIVLLARRAARTIRQPLSPEGMAVKVEQKFPDIDNRLINALLLAEEDDAEASELIYSVVEEGGSAATKVNLHDAVPKRRMAIGLAGSALAFLLMGLYAVLAPNHFGNALVRCLFPFGGIQPLTRTKIVAIEPKDKNVLSGDSVAIAVELAGRVPESAELILTPEGDEVQIVEMERQRGEKPRFRCILPDVARSLDYRVEAGDATSRTYRITVHHRPVVASIKQRLTPPAYTGLPPTERKGGNIQALAGSQVDLEAECSKPIQNATLVLSPTGSDQERQIAMNVAGQRVSTSFQVLEPATYHIELTDTSGFANKPVERDIEILTDEPPELVLEAPPTTVVVAPEGSVPFKFVATDGFGVQGASIVRIAKGEDGKPTETPIETWETDSKTQKVLEVTHNLPVSAIGVEAGKSATLQVVARDWNDVTGPGEARSAKIVVTILSPKEALEDKRQKMKLAALRLGQIIEKQRRNITIGTRLRADEIRKAGTTASPDGAETLQTSIKLQEEIRTDSGKLLELMDRSLPMRGVVELLYGDEMVTAVKQLRDVATAAKPADALAVALQTEKIILARLTGRSDELKRLVENAALRDLFAALDELIREEKKIRTATEEAAKAASGGSKALADRQDKLAAKVVLFKELLEEHTRTVAQSDPQQAKRFEQATSMLQSRQVRQNMLVSAAKLEKGQFSPAMPIQDKIIADLKAIADFLREPILAAASKKLQDLKNLVEEAKEKTERLKKLQAAIKEISEELERSKDYRGEEDKELAKKAHELEGIEQKIQDAVEQIAKDLALFPDVPTCNELVQEMREVFEDVEQKPGSENAKPTEIAVDRDEGMLQALDKIEERLADMEMWLMDKPDNIRWKQEAWDKNEMPEIPLVDLPEELEDLVGDLVDKAEEVDEQAQDSSSNASTADLPAGWDVADGPINNWSAKGKSGNERPNANEMAGRSGSGREGNSNGELVEGKAKDLEGRETKTRRTHDPFGEGIIEEENPKSQAKATGGGKQSGAGGEGGMRGTAPPRNELAMRDLERRNRELKRNTESVYSKASLLYLPTGELDKALLLMRKAEEHLKAGDLAAFSETQRRIVHALRNTKAQLAGQPTVDLDPRHRLPMDIREELLDARDEPIPPEFEDLVAEYYKAIANGAAR